MESKTVSVTIIVGALSDPLDTHLSCTDQQFHTMNTYNSLPGAVTVAGACAAVYRAGRAVVG